MDTQSGLVNGVNGGGVGGGGGGGEAGGRRARFRFLRAGVSPRRGGGGGGGGSLGGGRGGGWITNGVGKGYRRAGGATTLAALEEGVQFPAVQWSWDAQAVDPLEPCLVGNGQNDAIFEGEYVEERWIRPAWACECEGGKCACEGAGPWGEQHAGGGAGPDPACAYLLLGFPPSPPAALAALLATWRDWSAARHIYLHLPEELELGRVTLLRRLPPPPPPTAKDAPPPPPPPFQFLVVAACRCAHSPAQQAQLLEFARRLRAQKVCAYVTVYSPLTAPPVATI